MTRLVLPALLLVVFANATLAFELRGELQQGGMIVGQAAPGSKAWFNHEPLKVSPGGSFVFGFGRDAPVDAALRVCEPGRKCESRLFKIAQREYPTQHVTGVPQRTVTPPAAVLERIAEENRQVRQARAVVSERNDFSSRFQWPVIGPITGVFGSQRVYNGEPRRPHFGVDVARPMGTPVAAPAAATVRLAHPDMYYSGGTLIMDHGHGVTSTFIHLSKVLVEVGQEVAAGQLVGEIGAGGRATGPHLDWRMNWFGERLDPQLIVGPMPKGSPQEQHDD